MYVYEVDNSCMKEIFESRTAKGKKSGISVDSSGSSVICERIH